MIKMNDSLGKKANHDSFIDSVPNADIVEKSRLIEIHKGAVIVDIFVVILHVSHPYRKYGLDV